MVDKLKSLSGESVEYESKILTRFLQHSTISKALKAQTEYWLLRCTGTKQKITEKEVSCPWNTEQVFTRDEVVVFGRYLEFQKKLKGPKFVYVEAKKKDPAVIYSHLVRAVKIRMTPMARSGKQKDTPRFCIDIETHGQILMAILEVEAPIFERL
ncbi:hypothetical protein R1sor_014362 [Riccia sorocarpa]|uniref:Uncharacterized protein n=1 Tax=Riccia sorocarpa TaxID=122646 RepID=A0ABD3H967_9MARC